MDVQVFLFSFYSGESQVKIQKAGKMFSAKITRAANFKGAMQVLSATLSECVFAVNEKGFTVSQLDSSNVCLVSMTYDIDDMQCPEPTHFAVNIELLVSCLKNLPNSGSITIMRNKDSPEVILKSDGTAIRSTRFEVPGIALDPPQNTLSEIKFEYGIEIPIAELQVIMATAHTLDARNVLMRMTESDGKRYFSISATGKASMLETFQGSASDELLALGDGDVDPAAEAMQAPAQAKELMSDLYQVSYLLKFFRNVGNLVTVRFAPGVALILSYELSPFGSSSSSVSFILAPSVSETMED